MASYKPIVDRGLGLLRRGARQGERLGRYAASEGYGIVQKAVHVWRPPKKGMDDVTLARKVETKLFRGADAPKGGVNVNAVDGVVYLRGEVKSPKQVKDMEAKARSVPEVRDVENLLHLPKTPSPTRTDTPRAQRRTRTGTGETRGGAAKKQTAPGPAARRGRQVSAERGRAESEPAPEDLAEKGAGRRASPLGAKDEEGGSRS